VTVTPKIKAGILDANGIIGLAKSGCFSLTQIVFAEVFVPSLVVQEITDPLSKNELEQALVNWLKEEAPTLSSLQQVPLLRSEADRHVLGLALDHRPCVIVTGDRGLSNKAKQFQIATISAPRIVQLLAEAKFIKAAKPHLDQMRQLKFGIPQRLYEEILRGLSEL
jgi:predicted nucleic acid-binding protein